MKVQATSILHTTITGEITEKELIGILESSGLHIPANAGVRLFVKSSYADVDIDGEEPLRFSITFKGEPVTTPPASGGGDNPT